MSAERGKVRFAVAGSLVAIAAVGAIASIAVGQRPKRVLHEPLPRSGPPSPMIGGSGSGNPVALEYDDKLLPTPSVDQPRRPGEPLLGGGGFAADRATEMTPSAATGPDNALKLVSVFNPDVVAHKRMSSFDAITPGYQLVVGRAAPAEITVGGTTPATRDQFTGSVMIELAPGRDAPLPSVAPDMRILRYDVKPKVRLVFSKDGADNFYVRSTDGSAAGAYRLVYTVDADARYFSRVLPRTNARYTPRQVARIAPRTILPAVPDGVRANAEITFQKLGVDPDMELGVVMEKLVEYFRSFEEKPMPSTNDIYRDLVDHKAGVCRHRAFAFMITANALGIPTRYVQNEAHAFVEVWLPDRWQRIDLGGAAIQLDIIGAEDKQVYVPRTMQGTALPQPPGYRDSSQLDGDIRGLSEQQREDARQPRTTPSDQSGQSGQSNASPDRITPDPNLPRVVQDPKKKQPVLEILQAANQAYRGDAIHIEGRVQVAGKGLGDHQVDVYLSPKGQNGAKAVLLGRAVTFADGAFRQDFSVPAGLDLTTYEIWLSSPEDAYYNAALSN